MIYLDILIILMATKLGDDNIPPKILNLAAGVLYSPLTVTINSSINEKKNYRPVSILNSLSKFFENGMKEQLIPFFENCFSAFISAYRKEYSSQNVLMWLVESWRRCLDQSQLVGVIFMDLLKAFDCIPHDLIAKLEAYGLSLSALAYIYSYLKCRKQCRKSVRINSITSIYLDTISGVPQGSILGAFLFNIFINDLFLFIKKATLHNYADDNSLKADAENLQDLVDILQEEFIVEWLENNNMIPNPKKFQAIISAKKNSSDLIDIPIKIK